MHRGYCWAKHRNKRWKSYRFYLHCAAARNLVFVGDQMQLAQPIQGAHPGESGTSALSYLLEDHATVPPEKGIFLPTSRRMHPAICRFVSDAVYEGRLMPHAGTERQAIVPRPVAPVWVRRGSGILYVPVEHEGNAQVSEQEVVRIQDIAEELIGGQVCDREGRTRSLTWEDILFVAPYNAHVAEIRSRLHRPDVPVGTVDKFQGREGAVAIYSMASSSVDDAPRGMDFLYDLHRFNVAVSRARARAFVVASPELLRVLCRTPDQIRLANALCRYVELAR